jgi:hypothetical protein
VYEKITQLVDNIPLILYVGMKCRHNVEKMIHWSEKYILFRICNIPECNRAYCIPMSSADQRVNDLGPPSHYRVIEPNYDRKLHMSFLKDNQI